MDEPRAIMDFGSENTSPVHPAFAQAIAAANDGYATNFESEHWTEMPVDAG